MADFIKNSQDAHIQDRWEQSGWLVEEPARRPKVQQEMRAGGKFCNDRD